MFKQLHTYSVTLGMIHRHCMFNHPFNGHTSFNGHMSLTLGCQSCSASWVASGVRLWRLLQLHTTSTSQLLRGLGLPAGTSSNKPAVLLAPLLLLLPVLGAACSTCWVPAACSSSGTCWTCRWVGC
jgi:hypothetical protein